MTWESGCSAC